ncbi:MAG: DUF4865 family protein [Proteobacteria bacterium]|nr:DUF4865 family protein [Pseudomonadota bacterium]
MIALHYGFPLADGYDMDRIRARATEKGPLFDGLPDLAWKAFLGRTRDVDGSNEYATFYLWRGAEAACDFLLGDKFRAVVQAFGRPPVQWWNVARYLAVDTSILPQAATLARRTISPGADPAAVLADEDAHARAGLGRDGLHSYMIGFDPARWETVRFTLWHGAADIFERPPGKAYEVLYLAREHGAARERAHVRNLAATPHLTL